jgi:hypothetical protein
MGDGHRACEYPASHAGDVRKASDSCRKIGKPGSWS